MKNHIYSFVLTFLLIPALSFAGTAYYVDPNALGGGNGSYKEPWNSIAQVNNHKFSTGDDLYFRAGTTLNMTAILKINWHGSENDRVIIGAYYGNGLLGLGKEARPILKGNNNPDTPVPPGDYDAIINHMGPGYVTIQNLHIKESYSKGIQLGRGAGNYSQFNIIKNCRVEYTGRQGITMPRTRDGLIEDNFVSDTSLRKICVGSGNCLYAGAGIELSGMNNENFSLRNTIRGNTLTRTRETIGVYKGARYTTIENNTIYDVGQVGIYIANSRDGVIRNNLIYQPEITSFGRLARRPCIWIDNEHNPPSIIKVTGGYKIYNNYLAGGSSGIWLNNLGKDFGYYQSNNIIYGNRIVDCNENFRFHHTNEGWEGNEVYNNYSFVFSDEALHSNNFSPPGVNWKGNFFNTEVSGNAAQNVRINEISLKRETGWRSLKPRDLTRSWFEFTGENERGALSKIANVIIEPLPDKAQDIDDPYGSGHR